MKKKSKYLVAIGITSVVMLVLGAYLMIFLSVFREGKELPLLIPLLMLLVVIVMALAVRVLFERMREIKEEDDDYRNY